MPTISLLTADRETSPIWDSDFLKTDTELQSHLNLIQGLVPDGGYKLTNPFKLIQFEIIGGELADAFIRFIARYQELVEEQKSLKDDLNGRFED